MSLTNSPFSFSSTNGLGGVGMSTSGLGGIGMSTSGLGGIGMSTTQLPGVTSEGNFRISNGTLLTAKSIDVSKTKVVYRYSFINDTPENRTPNKYPTLFEAPLSETIESCLYEGVKQTNGEFSSVECTIVDNGNKTTLSIPKKIIDEFCQHNKISDIETVSQCYLLKRKKVAITLSNLQTHYQLSIISTLLKLKEIFETPNDQLKTIAPKLAKDLLNEILNRYDCDDDMLIRNSAFLLLSTISKIISFDEQDMEKINNIQKKAEESNMIEVKMKCFYCVVNSFIRYKNNDFLQPNSDGTNIGLLEELREDPYYGLLYVIVMRLQRQTNSLVNSLLGKLINTSNILTELALTSTVFEDYGEIWLGFYSQLIISFILTIDEQNVKDIFEYQFEFGARLLDCVVIAMHHCNKSISIWKQPLFSFVENVLKYGLNEKCIGIVLVFLIAICNCKEGSDKLNEILITNNLTPYSWDEVSKIFNQATIRFVNKGMVVEQTEWVYLYLQLLRKIFKYNPRIGFDFACSEISFASLLGEALTSNLSVRFKSVCLDLLSILVVRTDDIEQFWNSIIKRANLFKQNSTWDIVRECDSTDGLLLLSSFVRIFTVLLHNLPPTIEADLVEISPITKFLISAFNKLPSTLKFVLKESEPYKGNERKFCYSISRRFILMFTELIKLTSRIIPSNCVKNLKDIPNLPTELFIQHINDSMYRTTSGVLNTIMTIFSFSARAIETEICAPTFIKRIANDILQFLLTFNDIPENIINIKNRLTPSSVIVNLFEQQPGLISFVLKAGISFEMGNGWLKVFELLLEKMPIIRLNEVFKQDQIFESLYPIFIEDLEIGGPSLDIVATSLRRSGGNEFGLRVMGVERGENSINEEIIKSLIKLFENGNLQNKYVSSSIINSLLYSRVSNTVLICIEQGFISTIFNKIIRPSIDGDEIIHKINLMLLNIYYYYTRINQTQTNSDAILQVFDFYTMYCLNIKEECEAYECFKSLCGIISILSNVSDISILKKYSNVIIQLIKLGNSITLTPLTMTLLTLTNAIVNDCILQKDETEVILLSQNIISALNIFVSNPINLNCTLLSFAKMLELEKYDLPEEVKNIMPSLPLNQAHLVVLASYIQHHNSPEYLLASLPTLFLNEYAFPLLLALSTTHKGCLVLLRQGIFSILQDTIVLTKNKYIWKVLRNVSDRCSPNDLLSIQELLRIKPAIISMVKFPERLIRGSMEGNVIINYTLDNLEVQSDIIRFVVNVWNGNGDHPIIGDLLRWLIDIRNYSVRCVNHTKVNNMGKKVSEEDCYMNDIMSSAFEYLVKVIVQKPTEKIFSTTYNESMMINFLRQLYSTSQNKLEMAKDDFKKLEKLRSEEITNKEMIEFVGGEKEMKKQTPLKIQFDQIYNKKKVILSMTISELSTMINTFTQYFSSIIN
ncbi:hypothetical protein ENUP19_0129G0005 [Entamoeba nuttalli]|uniref:Nucleoporin n=2 Tax=Entamoeba nuttalli TaxID=412467 RepID=A0ABQ0DK10_9EUKA